MVEAHVLGGTQNPPKMSGVIEKAIAQFQEAQEADSSWRSDCLDDLKFSTGDQWPLNIKTQRESDGRPCLTMDKIQQSIRQVCNEYRQQRPAVQVNPIGDGANVDTAEIIQGSIRHIEVNSDAEIARDGAHEQVVRTGIGSWRLLSEYSDDESDEQEIVIAPIRNQFTVFWQPGVPFAKAKWAFIIEDVPLDSYKADYKESKLASLNEFTAVGISAPEWVTKDTVRVAEYFTVEEVPGKGKRPKKQVKWRKINAIEILEGGEAGQDLPGSSIPILTAVGDDIDVDGKRYVAGLVRNGKDPQRMHNYWNSAATEVIALAPKAPWQAIEGSIAGYEKLYEKANVSNVAVLPYKGVDVSGKPAPPPSRNTVEPPIQAITAMLAQSSLDLKASLGLYDPSLGQRKGDESGKAIERLQQQGDIGTLNFSDNMAREQRREGRLLIEWIRFYYDTPRIQRIIDPDGSVRQVIIHLGPEQRAAAEKMATDKIKKIYDIGLGRYDIAVSVGPSYQSKRQEAVATQLQLLKTLPQQLIPNFLDIIIRNMDIPQAKEFADRAKKLLPPNLQDGDESDPTVKVQKLEATLQQMGQQHQLLTKALGDAQKVIETKQIEQQGKVQIVQLQEQSTQKIAQMKIDAQVAIAEVGAKIQDAGERKQWVLDIWKELHGAAHEAASQAVDHAHEQDLAASQAANASASQSADQSHDLVMANQGANENAS